MPDTDGWAEDGAARWTPELEAAPEESDPALETVAMSEIDVAMEPLDDGARARVLRWAIDRYGMPPEEEHPSA
jgi:hypothetical protein